MTFGIFVVAIKTEASQQVNVSRLPRSVFFICDRMPVGIKMTYFQVEMGTRL